MLIKVGSMVAAVVLGGWIVMAYDEPAWTARQVRAAPETPPEAGNARCPVPRAKEYKRRLFDTARLPGGPYYVNDHTLIFGEDRRWHLFGIFHPEPYDGAHEDAFVHAISTVESPADWDAQSFQLSPHEGGIALTLRPELGETHLWAPHVIREGGRYVMVYQSGGDDNDRAQMRSATSIDLERWTRTGQAPLFEDICVARDPMLRRDKDRWTLYYTRCDSAAGHRSGVAYRTSTDLETFSAPRMALTVESAPPMFNSGYTESPFVFERDGWYYLSVTAYPVEWDATQIYCSRSPFKFSEPPVTRLYAHAAEWIVADGGQVFMTHAGSGQGGVWIEAMEFVDPE